MFCSVVASNHMFPSGISSVHLCILSRDTRIGVSWGQAKLTIVGDSCRILYAWTMK